MAETVIAIVGITGHLGRLIAKHILHRSSTAVIHGVCRTPSKLPSSLSSNNRVRIFQTGLDDGDEIRKVVKGADIAIFAALAGNDVMTQGQKVVIDACVDEGVPRFMAGDWSLDYRKLQYGELPAKDPMKQIAEYVDQKERETKGKIKGVHLLNACFMEVPWRGLYNGKDHSLQYWGTGDEKWELTTYDDAAQYSAALALDRDASGWFAVRGDQVSIHDIARDFETAFGFKPGSRQLGSLDAMYSTMHALRKEHPHNIWAWLPLFYSYYSINGQTTLPQPLSNSRYPDIKPATVREYFNAIGSPDKLGTPYDEAQK